MLDVIAFDADDTLWHNEILYRRTQERFAELLAPYHVDGRAGEELFWEFGNGERFVTVGDGEVRRQMES